MLKARRPHDSQTLLLLKLRVLEDCALGALRNDTRGLICARIGSLDIRLDTLLIANDILSNLFEKTSV